MLPPILKYDTTSSIVVGDVHQTTDFNRQAAFTDAFLSRSPTSEPLRDVA